MKWWLQLPLLSLQCYNPSTQQQVCSVCCSFLCYPYSATIKAVLYLGRVMVVASSVIPTVLQSRKGVPMRLNLLQLPLLSLQCYNPICFQHRICRSCSFLCYPYSATILYEELEVYKGVVASSVIPTVLQSLSPETTPQPALQLPLLSLQCYNRKCKIIECDQRCSFLCYPYSATI